MRSVFTPLRFLSTLLLFAAFSNVCEAEWRFNGNTKIAWTSGDSFKLRVFVVDQNYQTTNPYSPSYSLAATTTDPNFGTYYRWEMSAFTYQPGSSTSAVYGHVYHVNSSGTETFVEAVNFTYQP